MTPRFADAMTLHRTDFGFAAQLGEDWAIGPKIHGGVMVALCAKAAREAYADEVGDTDSGSMFHPVAVSVNFLSAPDPGSVRLLTAVRKRGRRIGLVDVELVQEGKSGERACVHAVVTLGVPEHDAAPLYCDDRVATLMAPEPPADVISIGPGHPAAEIFRLARGCEIRTLMFEDRADGQELVFQTWARPKVDAVDEYFALMCGDISLPLPYAVGRRGWAPTVQLTAHLRGIPADGWLRVACTATRIGQDWFDEDHTVVDSAGRVVVQTRQLALVPAG